MTGSVGGLSAGSVPGGRLGAVHVTWRGEGGDSPMSLNQLLIRHPSSAVNDLTHARVACVVRMTRQTGSFLITWLACLA